MLRKTKLVNFICAIMIGIIIMLAVVSVLFLTGVISLDKTTLVISTGGGEAKYDGIQLTNHTWDIEKGQIKKGHELKFTFKGTQTNVGESYNTIDIVITDELGADVTGDYKIDYRFGKLKINPRTILVTYDADSEGSQAQNSFEVSDKYDGLVFGHRIIVKPAESSDTSDENAPLWTVSVYDEFGGDVTYNYQIMMNSNTGNGENESDSESESESDSEDDTSNLEELFKVTADSDTKIYLKEQSYGDYDGSYWTDATVYEGPSDAVISPYYLTSAMLMANGAQTHNIEITSLCGKYTLPYYTSIGNDHQLQSGDVYITGDASKQYSVRYVNYSQDMNLQIPPLPAVAELELVYREFVYANYLGVDNDEVYNYMQSIIDTQGFDINDKDIINKIAEYISNAAEYDFFYDPELDNSSNIAIDFLETYKTGVCRHYATAATLLYRTLGIPARYTVGVAADALQNQTVIIGPDNRHAWVEVYVDGLGWVCVEVTGVVGGRDSDTGIVDGAGGQGSGESSGPNGDDQSLTDELLGDDVILYYITPQEDVSLIYLRAGSSGDYNGRSWLKAPEYSSFIRDTHSASYLPSLALENAAFSSHSMIIEPSYSSFALPYYTAFDSVLNQFNVQTSDTYFSGNQSIYTVSYHIADYEQFKDLNLPEDVADYELEYRSYVNETYLKVDDGALKDYLLNIINENSFNTSDIFTLISQVSEYVQGCAEYNLDYDSSIDESDDIILEFLNKKEGVCRHFASAATVMLRLLGVPARYTYGAVGSANAGERTEITGSKAHAWVEVYIDGIGWVQVEVTPGYSQGGEGNKNENGGDRFLSDQPPADEILYYITSQENTSVIYLKEGSAGDYNGKAWLEAPVYTSFVRDTYSASYLPSFALSSSSLSSRVVYIEPSYSSFALPYYTLPSSEFNTFNTQTSDTYYSGEQNAYYVSYYDANYQDFRDLLPADDLSEYEAEYRSYVYETYTRVEDGALKTYLSDIINSEGLGSENIYTLIAQVTEYVKGCASYDPGYDRAIDDSDDVILAFLAQKTGVCRHFASAATIMFRLLGVPARYTYGAVADSIQAGQRAAIKGDKAHAWVEVYIDGIGWVHVEATPGIVSKKGDLSVKFNKASSAEYDRNTHSFPLNDKEYTTLMGFEELEARGYSYELIGDNSFTDAGSYYVSATDVIFYDSNGNDVTDYIKSSYNINLPITSTDQIFVITRPIDINGGNFTKIYDGKPFDFYDESVTRDYVINYRYPENLREDHDISVQYICNGFLSTGNNEKHQITYRISVTDNDGNDVTREYVVKDQIGEVSIESPTVYITSGTKIMSWADYTAEFGDDPMTCHEWVIEYEDEAGIRHEYILPEDHQLNITFTGEKKELGGASNEFSAFIERIGENGIPYDVSENFKILCKFGTLMITK